MAAWQRESDYWQKRLERSDDQAAGLLTACLAVAVTATATAGYVQDNAGEIFGLVVAGIGLLVVAGILTLVSRIGSSPIAKRRGARSHQGPFGAEWRRELLEREQHNAETRERLARLREQLVGVGLIVFVIGLVALLAAACVAFY